MKKKKTAEANIRLNVGIPVVLHKKIRVRAAQTEKTIRDVVLAALYAEFK